MFDKLEALEERFQLVSEKISDPDIIADQESWRKYCKEHSDLTPIIDKYRELKSAKQTVADDKEMLDAGQDKEFEEMIRLAERREGVMQIELEFVEGNARARYLYEKMGFRITGVHPNAIRLKDGTLLNNYTMIKELRR